jgi:hypothetical protein
MAHLAVVHPLDPTTKRRLPTSKSTARVLSFKKGQNDCVAYTKPKKSSKHLIRVAL